ncbi:MAG: CHASE2 domain-containing protein [Deltaproteobacteria bacterium]|nr:CHASE2 domain-containing protein [Deltaproteobacteria bacterium]
MRIKKTIPDWIIGVAVTVFFLFISLTGIFDFTDGIEKKSFDFRARLAANSDLNPDIELVTIGTDDLAEFGRWPWSRDILAKGVDNLATAGARVIAMDFLFSEPEESAGLEAVKSLKETYNTLGLAQEGPGLSFYQELAQKETDLDNDAKLYASIKNAGNVVLPIYFDTTSSGTDKEAPEFISRDSFKKIKGFDDDLAMSSLYWFNKINPLIPSFAEGAVATGHINLFPDNDGSIRSDVHVVGYLNDNFFPSYPAAIVKTFQGLKDEDVTVTLGDGVDFRVSPSSTIKAPVIDYQMKTLLSWNAGPEVAFNHTPFSKVYKNDIQPDLFRDKIVIIGPTAAGVANLYVTPVSEKLPGIEFVANSVADILNQRFLARPGWIMLLEFFVMLIFGAFISFVLPRLKAGTGAVTTLGLFIVYLATGFVLFFSSSTWVKISPPLILLAVGYILIISKRFLITEKTKEKVEADSVETNKMLGLSFQQQGMLDLALEKFRKIPFDEEGSKDLLYNLGLDFERKRQFSKALSTYKLIIGDGRNFKDLDERIPKLKGAEATMIFGGTGGHPGDIGATILDMDTKPTLGRYQVVNELGRGAMGVVYKGEDPKIHRTVAIKTVRLSEFDDEMIEEIKERFFREAESAGLLTHPNIVTIYDAGEEHDLAYIAMEFLKGKDLEEFTQKEHLLPIRETLSIVAHVAEALDYAHSKGIVHRDIKPANIMRLDETQEVKVTDFGIARITASSKTKTGVIMGTPSYMSPEQVSGKKVDGRSDIFSLGIVLFEMIAGEKPFTGDDMTSLMYKVAKEAHPSIRTINPKTPPVVEKIINKALEKDPENRYQKAGQMAEHLKMVLAKIDEIQNRKTT